MRVLISGGAGFLGSHLCDRLLADGHEVYCADDLSTGSEQNVAHLKDDYDFALIRGDVSRSDLDLPSNVDWVLHFASPASPVAYAARPIETLKAGSLGTLNMLELAVRAGAKFMLASTSEVYGDPRVHPQPEAYWGNVNSIGWRSCYDEAKRFSEAATMAYQSQRGLSVRVPRIFNTYGPRMALNDGRPVVTFIQAALQGKPLPVQGTGEQTRSFCYVSDMVEALVLLMNSDYQKPINLGSTWEISILELAKYVLSLAASSSEIEFVQRAEDDPEVRRPDVTIVRRELGWAPKTILENGLAQTIEWVREQLRGDA